MTRKTGKIVATTLNAFSALCLLGSAILCWLMGDNMSAGTFSALTVVYVGLAMHYFLESA